MQSPRGESSFARVCRGVTNIYTDTISDEVPFDLAATGVTAFRGKQSCPELNGKSVLQRDGQVSFACPFANVRSGPAASQSMEIGADAGFPPDLQRECDKAKVEYEHEAKAFAHQPVGIINHPVRKAMRSVEHGRIDGVQKGFAVPGQPSRHELDVLGEAAKLVSLPVKV